MHFKFLYLSWSNDYRYYFYWHKKYLLLLLLLNPSFFGTPLFGMLINEQIDIGYCIRKVVVLSLYIVQKKNH